jgi:disease resistance protein RPM1
MEAAPVSAATGALKPVLGKLATLMGDEHKRLEWAHSEIKSLADELSAMDAALLSMSEEEDSDAQDKAWMNEVRELSYDMENSIDDFMQTLHDREGVEPDHGFVEKMKDLVGKMKARGQTGHEQINKQVGNKNGRYATRGTFSNTIHATVDPVAIAIYELLTKKDDAPKAELIKLLAEDEAGSESLLAEADGGCDTSRKMVFRPQPQTPLVPVRAKTGTKVRHWSRFELPGPREPLVPGRMRVLVPVHATNRD